MNDNAMDIDSDHENPQNDDSGNKKIAVKKEKLQRAHLLKSGLKRYTKLGNSKIHYLPHDYIGKGATSNIHRGYYEVPEVPAAVKSLDARLITIYKNELDILRESKSDHIVRYYATFTYFDENKTPISHFIAMELCEMSLFDYVENKNKNLDESMIHKFLKESCLGLEVMHKKRIIHRDIKPDNILIARSDDGLRAKLADFGISKKLSKALLQSSTKTFGTLDWTSPEMLNSLDHDGRLIATKMTDIFSLGLTMFYAIAKYHPSGSWAYIRPNIMNANFDYSKFLTNDKKYSYYIVLKEMLKLDENSRPRISSILEYPWSWPEDRNLDYIQTVSNYLSGPHTQDKSDQDINEIEKFSQEIFANGLEWNLQLCPAVVAFLNIHSSRKNAKKYNYTSVVKLIEFIRDKYQHYKEVPEDLKTDQVFGKDGPDADAKYSSYFTSRFPKLIPILYDYLKKRKNERKLAKFYK